MSLSNDTLFEIINKYINERVNSDSPVVNYQSATDLKKIFGKYQKWDGLEDRRLVEAINDYLHYSPATGNPNFNNQLYGGFQTPAFWGEVLTAVTNSSMATYEIAPVNSLLEQELVQKMASLIGYNNADGIMVTGGSNANMLAMMCARLRKFPNSKTKGYSGNGLIFVSDQSHYSFSKGANILGLGTENVITVESDHSGRMIPDKLIEAIENGLKENKVPFFVGATAGTTVKAAFDPFTEIHHICNQYDLWMHIDGAYGGSLLLCDEYRQTLLKGSELSDSFTWDAHKLMNVPMIASFFITKHAQLMIDNASGGGTKYIFHDYENTDYDTGKKSLQCGRRIDALKLWLTWKYHGDKKYSELIKKQVELASFSEDYINQHPQLELVYPRQSTNVCFQVIPENNSNINEFNYKLRDKIVKHGKYLINYAKDDKVGLYFRLSFANFNTTKEHMQSFFKDLLTS